MKINVKQLGIALLCVGIFSCEEAKKETNTNLETQVSEATQTPVKSVLTA